MRRRPCGRHQGTSLTEVLVAIVLVTLLLSATLIGTGRLVRLARWQQSCRRAAASVDRMLAAWSVEDPSRIPRRAAGQLDEATRFRWKTLTEVIELGPEVPADRIRIMVIEDSDSTGERVAFHVEIIVPHQAAQRTVDSE